MPRNMRFLNLYNVQQNKGRVCAFRYWIVTRIAAIAIIGIRNLKCQIATLHQKNFTRVTKFVSLSLFLTFLKLFIDLSASFTMRKIFKVLN